MAREEKLNLSLGFVQMAKSAFDNIKAQHPGRDDINPILATAASYYLNQWATGAMLLTGQQISQMEQAAGPLDTPEAIVKAVEKAANRDEGAYVVRVAMDPVYYEQLRQVAEWRGCSPEAVLEDCTNSVCGNGWYAEWEPAFQLRLSEKDLAEVRRLTGKEVPTYADLKRALRGEQVAEAA